MFPKYDLIVIGAGHAGCEAAAAAANLGSKVLMITMDMSRIAQMSCNPAMGGVAKGQIVREIDALGGFSGIVSDKSAIQFRMLNRSKGPAMWSPRTQNDRMLFHLEWRKILEQTKNLDFWQDMAVGFVVKGDKVVGVKTSMGIEIHCASVVVTSGTFLNGTIHIGDQQFGGGRIGEKASFGITEQLVDLGFESGRMKTGTPPRVDGRSLNFSKMEEQKGDENSASFSYTSKERMPEQRSCHITYTNPEVHELLKEGFDRSPMFNGRIRGTGPRYCPSIEDKIDRFAERDRHQIFVEPEGWDTVEIYVNGFSTSLPLDVQTNAIRKIEGFEKAKMFRPGYAIEYDYFPPIQLKHSLETKSIQNLYFAGQINGTTGYEEAACQGLMAGINAHQKVRGLDPFVLSRDEAYIGVLIDDLITKGTEEPYRMFTSRAEFRILLRQDNADVRLTPRAFELGLIGEKRFQDFQEKDREVNSRLKQLNEQSVDLDKANEVLLEKKSAPIKQKLKAATLIPRPELHIEDVRRMHPNLERVGENDFEDQQIEESVEIRLKYQGYIDREKDLADKLHRLEDVIIPKNFAYSELNALSSEAREKLQKVQPESLGQASRISGVSPADISVLLVRMKR
jgi:tRNA uridine 5-carboxymethylaminomethyl modification enzyme